MFKIVTSYNNVSILAVSTSEIPDDDSDNDPDFMLGKQVFNIFHTKNCILMLGFSYDSCY